MKQIFVVYETDAWHSTSHRECAGVFTSKWAAVNAIVKNHRIELDEFFDEDEIEHSSKRVLEAEARRRLRKELEFAYQTQGYETNYDIEVWNINEWYLTKKLSDMKNKERKSMIEHWVTEINPKAILRVADARCGARYAVYVVEQPGEFGTRCTDYLPLEQLEQYF